MSSLALRGLRCHACRRSILQSFVAVAGVTIPPSHLPRRVTAPVPRASFSLSHTKHSNSSPLEGNPAPTQTAVAENEVIEPTQQDEASSSAEHVPWYLQDGNTAVAAEAASHPLGQRQALPPIPENSPPLLHDILEQLSVDIGLDDLSIIDLRGLDPPPPLGANLIMILGTARSEKHLNVSGDRFCRWLRSVHKMKPVADGLMGRNELKIRLRRKARRAKLAKNVGRPERDDGLTTGWVCINVGEVEDSPAAKNNKPKTPSFVGFGLDEEKPRIVVQMLTGEKRGDIDLDTLWTRRLERYKKAMGEGQEENLPDEVRLAPDVPAGRPSNLGMNSTNSSRTVGPFQQRRGFHTSRPRLVTELGTTTTKSDPNPPPLNTDSYEKPEPADAIPGARSLFRQLAKLSKEEAHHELGQGAHDRNSTLFLRLFYQAASKPDPKSVLSRFRLIHTALSLSHPNYTKTDLFEAFQDLAASGGEITTSQGLMAVRALLSPAQTDTAPEETALRTISNADMNMALKVLEHLSLRGANIIQLEIFLTFFTAVGYQVPVRPFDESQNIEPQDNGSSRMLVPTDILNNIHQIQNRLLRAMELINVKLQSEDYIPILRILSNHGNYDKFWEVWRKMALRLVPRQKEHYLLLFQNQVEQKHQRDAAKCIWDWVPMMVREDPPVYVDPELAQAIMECLLLADPDIKAKALEGRPGQLAGYWLKCSEVLGSA